MNWQDVQLTERLSHEDFGEFSGQPQTSQARGGEEHAGCKGPGGQVPLEERSLRLSTLSK